MTTKNIVGGQLLFEVNVLLDSANATVLTNDVAAPGASATAVTEDGILKCLGQLPWLTVEVALAAGTDALSDFLVQIQAFPKGDWHDVQATSGDDSETLAAGASTSFTVRLGNPWALRFLATKAADNTNQVVTVKGVASAEGIVDW